MWIFLRDSFLSIVQHEDEPKLLQVRARIRGDIERVFPEAYVAEDHRSDYRFTTAISRERVAHVIANKLTHIDYTVLNDAIQEDDRVLAYDRAYAALLDEQVSRYGMELELPGFVPRIDLDEESVSIKDMISP